MGNQRQVLDKIGEKLGIVDGDLSQWYNVKLTDILKLGAGRMSQIAGGSAYSILKSVYPEYNWEPWRFKIKSKGAYRNSDFMESVLSDIESRLNLTSPVGWYRVSLHQVIKLGYSHAIFGREGLFEVLRKHRPEFPWDESKFVGVSHFGEKNLVACLKIIFSNEGIIRKYKLSDEIEVSAFIPSLKLAFDYQKDRYYSAANISGFHSFKLKADERKVAVAKKMDCEIVFVPFWWNRSIKSLLGTIHSECPRALSIDVIKTILNEDKIDLKPIPKEAKVNLSTWRNRRVAKEQPSQTHK